MSPLQMSRRVKTYKHRKIRAKVVTENTQSSPLVPINHENVTRSEMSRRMLKRARSVGQDLLDDRALLTNPERTYKKAKKNDAVALTLANSNAMDSTESLPFTAFNAFQTPFPPSSPSGGASKDASPEQMSPIPVAKHLLSRTSSHNLKENSRKSRPLDSPFHSRPGSANTSPKGKTQGKNTRIPLLSKTRTASITNKTKHTMEQKEPTFTLNYSTQNSPRQSKMLYRRPSNPTISNPFQLVTEEDWLVRPKVFSRSHGVDADYIATFDLPVGSSSFLSEDLDAFSTPARKKTRIAAARGSDVRLYASETVDGVPDFSGESFSYARVLGHDGYDMDMSDSPSPPRKYQLSRNSIFTSPTYDFTLFDGDLGSQQFNNDAALPHNLPRTEILPMNHVRTQTQKARHTDQRVIEYDIELPAMSSSLPTFDSPTWNHASAKQISTAHGKNPPSPKSNLKDMFSMLILEEGERGTASDEETRHDSGICLEGLPARARSLDAAAETGGKTDPGGRYRKQQTQVKTRNRRGTIRASDYNQPSTTINASGRGAPDSTINMAETTIASGPARRTRSGTVVGPGFKSTSKSLAPAVHQTTQPAEGEDNSEDELLLRPGWYHGNWQLADRLIGKQHSYHKRPMEVPGSDDELDFLTGGYCED